MTAHDRLVMQETGTKSCKYFLWHTMKRVPTTVLFEAASRSFFHSIVSFHRQKANHKFFFQLLRPCDFSNPSSSLQTHLLPCKPDKNTQIPQCPDSPLLPYAPSHPLPHFYSLSFGQDPSAPKIAKPKDPIELLPSSPSQLLPHFSASHSAPLSPSQLRRPSLTVVLTDSAIDPDCSGNSFRARRPVHHPTKEIRGAKKFRHAGIEPSLKFKFDRMFSSVNATGQYAWAPSSGAVGGNEDDLETFNVGVEGVDLEEGSGDLEENVNEDYENRNPQGVRGVHMSSSYNIKSSGKRKEREHSQSRARKKKSSGIGAQLVSLQQQLLDSMSSRSDLTSASRDLSGCSIAEVMAELQSVPGATNNDEFFFLATECLRVRRNREMWASINIIERKNLVGLNKASLTEKNA